VTEGVFTLLVPFHGAGICEENNPSQWNNQFSSDGGSISFGGVLAIDKIDFCVENTMVGL
jgi:hypothetical protein